MKLLTEYAEQAKGCREAASRAQTESEKANLLQMAEHWEVLARQRAAQMHLEDVLAALLKPDNGAAPA